MRDNLRFSLIAGSAFADAAALFPLKDGIN